MPQLNYFAVDLDIIDDPRIRKLTSDQGGIAFSIYLLTLSKVYSNGYYYILTEEDRTTFAADLHCKRTLVDETIKACFRIGLFSTITTDNSVITSPSIQRRYIQLCKLTGVTPMFAEYKLVDDSMINGRFPPTADDITAELSAHNWIGLLDPSEFIDYYAAIDWKIKGEPIADWKAKLSKWVGRRLNPQHGKKKREKTAATPTYEDYKPKTIPKAEPIPEQALAALRNMGVKV